MRYETPLLESLFKSWNESRTKLNRINGLNICLMRGHSYSNKIFCDCMRTDSNWYSYKRGETLRKRKLMRTGESWALLHTVDDTEHCKWKISTTWHSHNHTHLHFLCTKFETHALQKISSIFSPISPLSSITLGSCCNMIDFSVWIVA